jgi:hypothetical protein
MVRLSIQIAVLGTLVLAGCQTTPPELAHQPPTQVFNTTAKLAPIRDCIAGLRPDIFMVTPYREGWLVSASDGTVVNFSVELAPIPTGTRVELRVAKAMGHYYLDDALLCLDKLPRS